MMNFAVAQKYAAIASENLDFERGMLNLTATTGGTIEDVTTAFKRWVQTTPFPWRVALGYCLQRATEGKSLPFTVNG